MAFRYLLDTNILSDLVRHPQGTIAGRLAAVGEGNICTSITLSSELRFGAAKSGSTKLVDRVELILSALEILPFEPAADRYYANIRLALESEGKPIGPNDLFISANAMAQDLILVTANYGEFSRVPGLKVENWLA